jgi:hypothetical protein
MFLLGSHSNSFQVYIVGVHHDKLHITTVEFHEKYFLWIHAGEIPLNQFLVLRRSQTYDLSQPDTRLEGIRLILGLIKYLLF